VSGETYGRHRAAPAAPTATPPATAMTGAGRAHLDKTRSEPAHSHLVYPGRRTLTAFISLIPSALAVP